MPNIYSSIPHLPGSRLGKTDKYITEGQAKIATIKARPHDIVVVTEKLDGACVGCTKIDGTLVPLTRSGRRCTESTMVHHLLFADWVYQHQNRFNRLLQEGERVVGEWLALAHGMRYFPERVLGWEPFVALDIFTPDNQPLVYSKFLDRVKTVFHTPPLVSNRYPCSIEQAQTLHPDSGYGGEFVEGYVWRVERNNYYYKGEGLDYRCKWVNSDFQPGCLLLNQKATWNWKPLITLPWSNNL